MDLMLLPYKNSKTSKLKNFRVRTVSLLGRVVNKEKEGWKGGREGKGREKEGRRQRKRKVRGLFCSVNLSYMKGRHK